MRVWQVLLMKSARMLNHDFSLKPSRVYLILWIFCCLASIGVLLCIKLFWLLKVALIAPITLYALSVLKQQGLLHKDDAILSLCKAEKHWLVKTKQGEYQAELLGDSTVTAIASLLRLKSLQSNQIYTALIFPDSLEFDQYRKLLVVLRMF